MIAVQRVQQPNAERTIVLECTTRPDYRKVIVVMQESESHRWLANNKAWIAWSIIKQPGE